MSADDHILSHNEEVIANRAETVPLVFAEACKLRQEQDQRLEYTRRITGQFLSIFIPGSIFVALNVAGADPGLHSAVLGIVVLLVVVGFGFAFPIFKPREWQQGPNISDLIKGPLTDGIPLDHFYLTLAVSYDSEYEANERQVRTVQRLFAGAIFCFLLSAAVFLVGLVAYDGHVTTSNDPGGSPETSQPADIDSGSAVPPLPEVKLVEPTYVERGANDHYVTRSR